MIRTWGRVLRLSLSATAVADVLAGSSLALAATRDSASSRAGSIARLVAASLCVYHGGMALNDWADREIDARERPERPLPSGAVSAPVVLAVAAALLVSGCALAAVVELRAGLAMAAVSSAVVAYDLVGRGPWRGPLLLGLCRAGNVAVPILALAGSGSLAQGLGLAPVAYGLYVFVLSRLGRFEDAEEALVSDAAPRRLVATASVLLALVWGLPLPGASLAGRGVAALLGVAAGLTLWRAVSALRGWSRADVERTMGMCLRRLLMFSGALAALPGSGASLALTALILAGYPVARSLRRVFPPS
jgi:4-hydroxybenzoate polyprenyltransferase